jgi:biopolymer transport protein TolR
VIQPVLSKGHKAQLPLPPDKPETATPPDGTIVVQVLGGNALKINDEVHTWESFGPRMEEIFKLRATKIAFIRSEDVVLFQEVARAIDIMRSSGVDRVGLLTAFTLPREATPNAAVRR